MKTLQTIVSALAMLMLSQMATAQKGTIRGTIIDEIGEPLFSGNVVIKGTTNGTTTDFDGAYELRAEPGTYDLVFSFIGYTTVTITGIEVKADEVSVVDVVKLAPSTNELAEVVITSEQARNTEAALLTVKKKSVNVLDGISAQTFRKIGDGNAAAAVTRVPGVSVQGGKYVFVRGLGDRYTKTQLNGMDVPGLDPDRNSLQMDIFPTNVVNNIVVLKSFTADLPADFVGGLVNIETKEFPDKKSLSVSAGLAYTPGMHFNPNYLKGDSHSGDFLGFDDGSRDEPLGMGPDNPNPSGTVPAPTPSNVGQTRQFGKQLDAMRSTSFMNYSLGLSAGDQIKGGSKTYGYNVALAYKNSTDFYAGRQQNIYRKNTDPSVYELRDDKLQIGDLGVQNVFSSVMLGGAMKSGLNKYKVNLLHLQNGESRAGIFYLDNFIESSNSSMRDNLEYSQRNLTNLLISGSHQFAETEKSLEWSVAPTYSSIQDKDIRSTAYLMDFNDDDTSYSINASEVGFPKRLWRNLAELDVASKVDYTQEHEFLGRESKFKGGVAYTFKNRDYNILGYELISQTGTSGLNYSGEADELLTDDYIYDFSRGSGTFYFGNYQRSNTYNSIQSTAAVYGSEEMKWSPLFKTIIGLRVEQYNQFYTGQNQAANVNPESPEARVYNNTNVLSTLGWFPSASMILQANENSNFRLGYFRTVARPSFKEKSEAQIVDPISGLTFIGNIDLVETDINNFDLRYEYFFEGNQTIALSGFYKNFSNPIELVSYQSDADSYQPRNVGDATVMGLEVESRLNFGFMAENMKAWAFNTNITIIDSRVKYDRTAGGTYDAKEATLREGEELGEYRDMQGQAPYIVNAGLSYSGRDNGIETGIYYNVQGPKLEIVGLNLTPDVYSEPFHSLNFNFMKKFGKENQYQLGFSVDNILNDNKEAMVRSFGTDDRIFSAYSPGRTFGLNFSYRIK